MDLPEENPALRELLDGQTLTSESATGTTLWYTWDTTQVGNGNRTLTATVTLNGQTATIAQAVTVANSANTSAPPPSEATFTVAFTYPTAGATVNGAQTVGLSTTAAWGQSKTFTLSIDGQTLMSESATGTTLWYRWDTTQVGNGNRTLTATVTMNGQTATTAQAVTVANSGTLRAQP